MADVVMTGHKEIDANLTMMRQTSGRRAINLGLRKSAQEMAKDVKASIPSRYKEVRKGVGYRNLKVSEAKQGGAKVGAGVGKARQVSQKIREGRKGVGIARPNIHWWFLGTGPRFNGMQRRGRSRGGMQRKSNKLTGNKIRYTGKMPPQSLPVAVIVGGSAGKYSSILELWTKKGIEAEMRKGKAF